MEGTAIVDVQGYRLCNKTFIIKEICILCFGHISHFIFLPPFDYKFLNDSDKYQIKWLTNKYHGLEWSSGSIDYKEKDDLIKKSLQFATCIYVKGEEKTKWLKEIVQNIEIVNIEKIIDHNFRLKDENVAFVFKCFHHDKNRGICSCNNVFKIFQKISS